MTKSMVINNHHLSVRAYKGQNVVTFKDIDAVHSRPKDTARKRFNDNRKHFVEGVDYFKLQPSENRTVGINSPNGGIVLTESGYLMLAKSFTDDLAWEVQRQLVNFYFRANQSKPESSPKSEQLTLETSEYHYFDKTFRGQPVLSTKDIAYFVGVSAGTVNWHLRSEFFDEGTDYYKLEKSALREFKHENPNVSRTATSPLHAVTKSGFIKLMKMFKCEKEPPAVFTQIQSYTGKIPLLTSKEEAFPVYKPNEEMNRLMADVRDKAERIAAFSYLLTNVDLEAKSRMYRGELRCEIQRLNMMIDKIDDVRF